MVLVRLTGGLGNQMFQYATAKAYQRKKSELIILDTHLLQNLETDIDKIIQRPLALHIFPCLQASVIRPEVVRLISGTARLGRIRKKLFDYKTVYIKQQMMEAIPFRKAVSKNIYLEGNFQSESYFKDHRPDLLKDFSFPPLDEVNAQTANLIAATPNALSLHIRRGDYHSNSNKNIFTSVNLAYYHNAIESLFRQLHVPKIKTFVFSDDFNWVKQNFASPKLDVQYVEGNDALHAWKDMCLMSLCQHHIIANSSFSWWGAWLSQRNGLHFAPRYWFRPHTYTYDIYDIVPESWTIVNYPLD